MSASVVSRIGLPLSIASTRASVLSLLSIRSAVLFSTFDRSAGDVRPQASRTACAASSASSTSSAVERAIVQMTRPLIGDMLSKCWPRTAGTHLPPIQLS